LNVSFGSLPHYGLKGKREAKAEPDAEAEGLNVSFGSLPHYGLKEKREFKV
jgi:hypothetical protein